jgi:hypothetical protein
MGFVTHTPGCSLETVSQQVIRRPSNNRNTFRRRYRGALSTPHLMFYNRLFLNPNNLTS